MARDLVADRDDNGQVPKEPFSELGSLYTEHLPHLSLRFRERSVLMMLIFGELCKSQFLTSVIQCNLCNRTSSLGQVILLRFIPV